MDGHGGHGTGQEGTPHAAWSMRGLLLFLTLSALLSYNASIALHTPYHVSRRCRDAEQRAMPRGGCADVCDVRETFPKALPGTGRWLTHL